MLVKKIICVMSAAGAVYGCILPDEALVVDTTQESVVSEGIIDRKEQYCIATGGASWGNSAITGTVCIVTSYKQLSKIRQGDIVIAPAIGSRWYPLLDIAGGIITEKPNSGSNNVVALGQKLNIPVIAGATGLIKNVIDGQTITLDPVSKNIYHVAYPVTAHTQFEALALPHSDHIRQEFYEKFGKFGNNGNLVERTSENADILIKPIENQIIQSVTPKYKTKRTKEVYLSHFSRFKKFLLKEKAQFQWTKKWLGMKAVEQGARTIEGYDDIAVACICIGESFLEKDEKHVVSVMQKVGQSDRHIEHISLLLEECKSGDLNDAARIAHELHIKAIETPKRIKKEILIEYPREYKNIEDEVDEDEREALTVCGYFLRYCLKNKLPR